MREKLLQFFKQETVFCCATLLAILSMFIVPPNTPYFDYIDYRVLALLLSLMIVVAGLSSVGIFNSLMHIMLKKVKRFRELAAILILSCFFIGMWVTNDVVLITFVPFAILTLSKIDRTDQLIPVIIFQTIAANLGSMCTPIGNPQNLYLYTISGMQLSDFVLIMFPFTLCALVLILLSLFKFDHSVIHVTPSENENTLNRQKAYKTLLYFVLLIFCLLSVLRLIDYRITLLTVIIIVFLVQRDLLLKADFMLLLTFVSFFVFVGNIKNIDAINHFLSIRVNGNELLYSILSSQFISNVPAAILLSGFTQNTAALMVGTNLGGLGTLIASMASLISFKYYTKIPGCNKKKYLFLFTLVNLVFLAIMLLVYFLLKL